MTAGVEQADAASLRGLPGAKKSRATGIPFEARLHGALRETVVGILRGASAVGIKGAVWICATGKALRHVALPGLERR